MRAINTSLVRKIGSGLFLLLILMFLAIGAVFFQVRAEKSDAIVIATAGRQRMLSQQIAKFALLVNQGDSQITPKLLESSRKFDDSLKTMITGNQVDAIPAATDGAREQLIDLQLVWEPVYANVQSLLVTEKGSTQQKQALNVIIDSNEVLLQKSSLVATLLQQQIEEKVSILQIYLIIIMLVFLIVFGGVLWVVRRSIAPLDTITSAAKKVATGDLTQRVHIQTGDELETLAEAFNQMIIALSTLSGQVRQSAQSIVSASSEIVATATEHTVNANEQSSAIHQITTTIEQVRATADESVSRFREVAKQAQDSFRVSQEGSEAAEAIIVSMQNIFNKVQTIRQDIKALSEQTQQIGEITSTVNQIADQSNLLALNATIEAAKAGEQGKGFAVVATEVRNLAEQSKQATAQVRAILGDIQKATEAVVLDTEQGAKGVEEGMSLAQRTDEVIQQLEETIHQAAQTAQQISSSANQQSSGMDQITQAMKEIYQTTQQFVVGTSQSEQSAKGLDDLAQQLLRVTEGYKLA